MEQSFPYVQLWRKVQRSCQGMTWNQILVVRKRQQKSLQNTIIASSTAFAQWGVLLSKKTLTWGSAHRYALCCTRRHSDVVVTGGGVHH